MEKMCAAYHSPAQQQLLMESYEELKHIICKKGNTAVIKREKSPTDNSGPTEYVWIFKKST